MWTIQTVDEAQSTQDLVRASWAQGEGLVIRAFRQTAGRGRHGRQWQGLDGNLFFSMLLKPERPLIEVGSLALVIGLALAETIDHPDVQLKWPNDILLEGRKCAGILCEVHDGFVIAGVGVNVAVAPEGSACLGAGHDAAVLMQRFLDRFEQLYLQWQQDGFAPFRDRWLALAHPRGQAMSVKQADRIIAGAFDGLGDDGALLLRDENGAIRTVTAGELYVTGH